jgi:hypothetical protein
MKDQVGSIYVILSVDQNIMVQHNHKGFWVLIIEYVRSMLTV